MSNVSVGIPTPEGICWRNGPVNRYREELRLVGLGSKPVWVKVDTFTGDEWHTPVGHGPNDPAPKFVPAEKKKKKPPQKPADEDTAEE